MAFSFKTVFRRTGTPGTSASSAPVTFRTTEQLEAALNGARTLAQLGAFLQGATRSNWYAENEERLSSCSGTADAILHYLAFGRIKWGADSPKDGRFASVTKPPGIVSADTMFRRLMAHSPPYAAVLEEEADCGSHVVLLVNTSGYWSFYQSNVGTGGVAGTAPGFSVSSHVNALHGKADKNRLRMNEQQLMLFFREMVAKNNASSLFYGSRHFYQWKIALFTLGGQQLDLSR